MKSLFQGGDVATVKELIVYEVEAIAKREILSNNDMKFILVAFDGGESSAHIGHMPTPSSQS